MVSRRCEAENRAVRTMPRVAGKRAAGMTRRGRCATTAERGGREDGRPGGSRTKMRSGRGRAERAGRRAQHGHPVDAGATGPVRRQPGGIEGCGVRVRRRGRHGAAAHRARSRYKPPITNSTLANILSSSIFERVTSWKGRTAPSWVDCAFAKHDLAVPEEPSRKRLMDTPPDASLHPFLKPAPACLPDSQVPMQSRRPRQPSLPAHAYTGRPPCRISQFPIHKSGQGAWQRAATIRWLMR